MKHPLTVLKNQLSGDLAERNYHQSIMDIRVNVVDQKPKEPLTVYKRSINFVSPDQEKWQNAMENLKSLEDNDIWELVQLPKGRKAVGSKWVYKMKTYADGSIECYKA